MKNTNIYSIRKFGPLIILLGAMACSTSNEESIPNYFKFNSDVERLNLRGDIERIEESVYHTYPAGRKELMETNITKFDTMSNVIRRISYDGFRTDILDQIVTYDIKMKQKTIVNKVGGEFKSKSFRYGLNDKLLYSKIVNSMRDTTVFCPKGNLNLVKKHASGGNVKIILVDTVFNKNLQMVKLIYCSETDTMNPFKSIEFKYDSVGRRIQQQRSKGNMNVRNEWTYYPTGQMETMNIYSMDSLLKESTFDYNHNIVKIVEHRKYPPNTTAIIKRKYRLDKYRNWIEYSESKTLKSAPMTMRNVPVRVVEREISYRE